MAGRDATSSPTAASPIGIIAAGGAMPFAVADSALADGRDAVLFGFQGVCDPDAIARYRHHWIRVGQFGRLFRLLRAEHISDIVFIGTMVRPAFSEFRLDWTTLRAMPLVFAAFRGGDDHLLTSAGRFLEKEGLRLLGVQDVAPALLMPSGCLTRRLPDAAAEADIAKGLAALRALSPFDVGQAIAVIDGHIVGIEDIEGTDGLLARIARLRAEGRIRAKIGRGVLVKAPKSTQDLRFDLPTMGPRTVEGVAAAGLGGIAMSAGQSILADGQTMIATANAADVFVVGLPT